MATTRRDGAEERSDDGVPDVGLGREVVLVYRALLDTPDADLADVEDRLGLRPGEAGAALDVLAERALLRPSQVDPARWRPISPEVAMRRLVAEAEADLEARTTRVRELRDEVVEFVDDWRARREERLSRVVESLDTSDAVVGVLEELTESAREEILAFVPNRPSSAAVEQSRASDERLLARGVTARTIHLEGAADRAFVDNARWLAERGAHIRLAPTLPVRMVVYDRAVAVVAVDPQDPTAGAVVLRGRGVLAALVALFELQWTAARSVFDQPAGGDGHSGSSLSPMESEVLRLLARGLKDDSVARHLGVSVRTARRFIADLTERAGAASRFELGVRAKELGWL